MSLLSSLLSFFQLPIFDKNAVSMSSKFTNWLSYICNFVGVTLSGDDSGVQQLMGFYETFKTVRALFGDGTGAASATA